MSSKRTTFNPVWMNANLNPNFSAWLEPVNKSPYEATCKKCNVRINLSNMGRQALISHMEGLKYQKTMNATVNLQLDMKTFINKAPSKDASEEIITVAVGRSEVESSDSSHIGAEGRDEGPLPGTSVTTSSVKTYLSKSITKKFLASDQISKAEILWALKTVSLSIHVLT